MTRSPENLPAPLSGLRVIELGSYVAAPLGGMTLAQLGADVIRVDPPGGAPDVLRWPLAPSGVSLYWTGLNKAKRSVVLDLRSEPGRAALADLVASGGPGGGIVITNAGNRAGQRYEELRERRPDLVYVEVTGAADGRPAVDYTVNASAGFPLVTGPEEGRTPVNHVLPAWDVACGLYTSVAVLAAVREREQTGRGQHVQISLEDVALATAGNLGYLAEAELHGIDRPRIGNAVYGTYAHAFATADGAYLMVVALTARHWNDLVHLTGTGKAVRAIQDALGVDFSVEDDRYRHHRLLDALLEPWFAGRGVAEAEAALASSSVLWSRFRSFREIVTAGRDQLLANPVFGLLDQPGVGTHVAPGSPLRFDGRGGGPRPAPRLGEHTDEVLAEVTGRTAPPPAGRG